MSEDLVLKSTTKEGRYRELLPQLEALLAGENDLVACMANISAALGSAFGFWWVGFYLVKGEELVLGPFQGPVACTRIRKGKGVCGTSWQRKDTVIVEDVEKFPGHIACSSLSKSEIVIPVFGTDGDVAAVLDVDSDELNAFDSTDALYLKKIGASLTHLF